MNQENIPNSYMEDDEITLKELILKLQEFYQEIWRNWKLVVLIPIPFVAFMLYKAITTPGTYPASLTFMINDDEGGGGGISGILGSFGFGMPGGSDYNLEKLLQLSKSRKIIQMVLFEKVAIDGQNDYYANHLIREYELHEKWEDDTTGLKGFLFIHDSIPAFSNTENKVLKSLHGKIIGNPETNTESILSTGYGEETGIMTFTATARSEASSIFLVETVYEKLSRFYIDKSIEKQKKTYEVVKAKTDSLLAALNSKQYALLNFQDQNRGLTLKKYEAREKELQRDIQVLGLAYGESLKNMEIADFTLKNKTPFVQTIDLPIPPIKPTRESKLKAIILGGFLGGFLAVGFIIGRKIFRDAMASEA